MGIVIQTGGAWGQAGAGLGQGTAKGVEMGLANAREDQLRQEAEAKKRAEADAIIGAIGQSVQQDFTNQAALVPDTVMGTAPGVVGQRAQYNAPEGMSPIPGSLDLMGDVATELANPDDLKIQETAARFDKLLASATTPEQAAILKQSAGTALDGLIQQRTKDVLASSFKGAAASGLFAPEEIALYAQELDSGSVQPDAILQALTAERSKRLDTKKRVGLKGEKVVGLQTMLAGFDARIETEQNPNNVAWLKQQKQAFSTYVGAVASAFESDPENFDMAAAFQGGLEMATALDPTQAARVKQQNAIQMEGLKAEFAQQAQSLKDASAAERTAISAGVDAYAAALRSATSRVTAAIRDGRGDDLARAEADLAAIKKDDFMPKPQEAPSQGAPDPEVKVPKSFKTPEGIAAFKEGAPIKGQIMQAASQGEAEAILADFYERKIAELGVSLDDLAGKYPEVSQVLKELFDATDRSATPNK